MEKSARFPEKPGAFLFVIFPHHGVIRAELEVPYGLDVLKLRLGVRGLGHGGPAVEASAVLHNQGRGGYVADQGAGLLQAHMLPGGYIALHLARHADHVGVDGALDHAGVRHDDGARHVELTLHDALYLNDALTLDGALDGDALGNEGAAHLLGRGQALLGFIPVQRNGGLGFDFGWRTAEKAHLESSPFLRRGRGASAAPP